MNGPRHLDAYVRSTCTVLELNLLVSRCKLVKRQQRNFIVRRIHICLEMHASSWKLEDLPSECYKSKSEFVATNTVLWSPLVTHRFWVVTNTYIYTSPLVTHRFWVVTNTYIYTVNEMLIHSATCFCSSQERLAKQCLWIRYGSLVLK
jgi:hypothetical protein